MSDHELMLKLLQEVREDQKAMGATIVSIKVEQTRQNEVVKIHEQRSTELEKIVEPMKQHFKLLHRLTKVVGGMVVTVLTAALLKVLNLL